MHVDDALVKFGVYKSIMCIVQVPVRINKSVYTMSIILWYNSYTMYIVQFITHCHAQYMYLQTYYTVL